jgi:hypothetical protein
MLSGSPAMDSLTHAEQSALRDVHDLPRDAASRRSAAYQFACLKLSTRLTHEEESELRASGELPAWFRPELDRLASEIRRNRGRN